jgi:predicted phage terminase large subunit-like protein
MSEASQSVLVQAMLRQDLGTFVAKVFQHVCPGDLYLHNWHIDAIVFQLMEVYQGRSRRLILTQPPRSLKSICSSVGFVAWWLGHDPSIRIACVSYSQDLAATFARQFRSVVTSAWYKAIFPRMRLAKDTEMECVTTRGGGRTAISVGGSLTGRGADVIIIDDPMKADDAHSETTRRSVNEWYSRTLVSRLDDKEHGAIILVMQRLHEDDLAGMLLQEGFWRHLDLPAIAEEDQQIPIGIGGVYKRKKGEALHAIRESLEVLANLKKEMGSLTFSAQYQQRPIPLDGNLIRRSWIKWYESLPVERGANMVQSWDVASTTGKTSDYSVCTTWLKLRRTYYLADLWRGRLEFPDLRRKVIELAHMHKPTHLLIEEVGLGIPLVQDLRVTDERGVPVPISIKPDADKIVRMEAQAARFEAGQVCLPKEAPWLDTLLHELMAFPNSRHDDQIDSISQFLNWAEARELYEPIVALVGPKFWPIGGNGLQDF